MKDETLPETPQGTLENDQAYREKVKRKILGLGLASDPATKEYVRASNHLLKVCQEMLKGPHFMGEQLRPAVQALEQAKKTLLHKT